MNVSECSEDDGSMPELGYYASGGEAPRPSTAPPLKISATTAEQRREVRRTLWNLLGGQLSDQAESELSSELWLPWQLRGPPGPKDGGPTTWKNQTFKEKKKQIWANNGGAKRDQWAYYFSQQRKGVNGRELHKLHPKNPNNENPMALRVTKGKGNGKDNGSFPA